MASELKAVEDAKADVAKLKAEYQDFLSRVDELARKRMKEIEAEGDARAHEIREKARLEAERIVEDARLDIRYEWGKTREALKKDMIEMVISVTERMIQEKLTFEDDRKIIDGFLKELEQPS
jgi:F-type H+-transporting ATPase subunit b